MIYFLFDLLFYSFTSLKTTFVLYNLRNRNFLLIIFICIILDYYFLNKLFFTFYLFPLYFLNIYFFKSNNILMNLAFNSFNYLIFMNLNSSIQGYFIFIVPVFISYLFKNHNILINRWKNGRNRTSQKTY